MSECLEYFNDRSMNMVSYIFWHRFLVLFLYSQSLFLCNLTWVPDEPIRLAATCRISNKYHGMIGLWTTTSPIRPSVHLITKWYGNTIKMMQLSSEYTTYPSWIAHEAILNVKVNSGWCNCNGCHQRRLVVSGCNKLSWTWYLYIMVLYRDL